MNEVADEECRGVCKRAYELLKRIEAKVDAQKEKKEQAIFDAVRTFAAKKLSESEKDSKKVDICASWAATLTVSMIASKFFTKEEAAETIAPGLVSITGDKQAAEEIATAIFDLNSGEKAVAGAHTETDETDLEEGEDLCDCKFSLAYGSKILLNNARLHLKRGKRYGIVAQKSAGKTTLLRSIANYQIDGFPTADQLKTCFVDTDVQGFKRSMTVAEFVQETTNEEGLTLQDCKDMLLKVEFTPEMIEMPVTSLSGGWRMKLALARAMLRKADILLMDEPTNHLDVLNVQWVVDYLTGPECEHVTSPIVSHDTGSLEKTATNIIHFADLKLSTYKGAMTQFVERFPEAKSYFDLTASSLKFSFPEPGPLEGVRSKGKPLMTMTNVSFTTPAQPAKSSKTSTSEYPWRPASPALAPTALASPP